MRILALLICFLAAASSLMATGDIHCAVISEKALELVQNRQLTFASDGITSGQSISPDWKQVAFLLDKDDDTRRRR